MERIDPGRRARLTSAFCVAALHGLVLLAMILGPTGALPIRDSSSLVLFDVAEPPPPPEIPSPARTEAEEGAASPANLRAKPAPVVVPPPRVQLPAPSPIAAAPIAGPGAAPDAGAADRPGPGTGAGGKGTGTGSGDGGSGTGGGAGQRARLRSGTIVDADYPRAASRARAEGAVTVRFRIAPDGRVSGCRVTRSSGNGDLDEATCRLIEERFRYEPARDGAGRAVSDVAGWRQTWWFERR